MMLASTRMADRHGKIYSGSVRPDVLLEDNDDESDSVLSAAIEWLKQNTISK